MYTTRKAYGAHGVKTLTQQAKNIAWSIVQHRKQGIERTLADYGVMSAALTEAVEQLLAVQA